MGPDVGYSWITGPVRRLGVAGPVAGMESWMGWDRNLYLGWDGVILYILRLNNTGGHGFNLAPIKIIVDILIDGCHTTGTGIYQHLPRRHTK